MGTEAGAIPVYLLTGFLGSGKTTLLSQLVHTPAFQDTAVVINEFGEVGLDHLLVGQADDNEVVLLDSGCLCCAASSSLADTLESLYYRRYRGELPPFERVVVETSGLADPGPVINTLASDALIARHYRFGGAVATLDALHGIETVQQYREAATQITIADRIAVTKIDVASDEAIAMTRQLLTQHNPTAEVFLTSLDSAAEHAPMLFKSLQASHIPDAMAVSDRAMVPGRIAHVLRYGIASYLWRQTQPIGWEVYAKWVRQMQRQAGENLLRVKGLLRWEDGTVRTVHGVHHLFSHPEVVTLPSNTKELGSLIVIARDLSAEELKGAMSILGML